MASGDDQSNDFYAVLGLKKECSALELRNAYKKLALRWHPDRCSASGNPKFVEEAKKKFQAIQEAYSVLSDENKRFLYDVGVYDCDDDDEDEQGMGEFLGEMAVMMSQTKACDDGQQSFEDLQTLFEEMFHNDIASFQNDVASFQNDIAAFSSNSQSSHSRSNIDISSSSTCNSNINSNNKRNCLNLGPDKSKVDRNLESLDLPSFCFGVGDDSQIPKHDRGNGRRTGRKQKMSSQEDVASSHGSKISV